MQRGGGGLDLTARQFELQIDAAPSGGVGDRDVFSGRQPGVGVDEKELLLDPDGGRLVSA